MFLPQVCLLADLAGVVQLVAQRLLQEVLPFEAV